MKKSEALSEIQRTAELILTNSGEPAVRIRLLRDILKRPDDDPEIVEAKEQLEDTEWVRLLTENQNQRGDFQQRLKPELRSDVFSTSLGIALDIGLATEHPVVARAKRFAERCLSDGVLSTLPQMNPRSPGDPDLSVFERDLASMLAKVDRESPLVEEVFGKWMIIAGVALSSGEYDKEAQKEIHEDIFGPEYNLGHSIRYPEWVLAGAAGLLAARADLLDPIDDEAYTEWLISDRSDIMKGIERLLSPTCKPSHKSLHAVRILLNAENLYGFRNWGVYIADVADCFWQIRGDDGFWNLGSACANPYYTTRIRLSGNWRGKRGAHDWTTRILLLLQRYYEDV
ncbi:hypothetical protein ACFL6S_32310 [Candidatus Poribacteria bacterium]